MIKDIPIELQYVCKHCNRYFFISNKNDLNKMSIKCSCGNYYEPIKENTNEVIKNKETKK